MNRKCDMHQFEVVKECFFFYFEFELDSAVNLPKGWLIKLHKINSPQHVEDYYTLSDENENEILQGAII